MKNNPTENENPIQETHVQSNKLKLRLSQWFSFSLSSLTHFHIHDLLAMGIFNAGGKEETNFSRISKEMLLNREVHQDYKILSSPKANVLQKQD